MEPDLNKTPPNTPVEPHPHCLYYTIAAQCTSRSALQLSSIDTAFLCSKSSQNRISFSFFSPFQTYPAFVTLPRGVSAPCDTKPILTSSLLKTSTRNSQSQLESISVKPVIEEHRPGEYYLCQLKELPELLIPIKSY